MIVVWAANAAAQVGQAAATGRGLAPLSHHKRRCSVDGRAWASRRGRASMDGSVRGRPYGASPLAGFSGGFYVGLRERVGEGSRLRLLYTEGRGGWHKPVCGCPVAASAGPSAAEV
ncbi:hypothetical protein MRX96_030227 [Rhipicephalus microplus]